MRARNLKPTFFKNPDLADLGPIAQLLFAGLWCLADKEGRLKDQPRVIKAEVFPYYDADVNGELTKLERLGFVRRYVASGMAVIEVLSFRKHQSPHHTEKASDLPAFVEEKPEKSIPHENHREPTVDQPLQDGGNPSDSLIPDSLTHDSGNSRARDPEDDSLTVVPRGSLAKIRDCYPVGLYGDNDWLLAEREIAGRLAQGVAPADLVGAAAAYAAQQEAIGKVGTQYIQAPSRFFARAGKWRGPFPLPAKPETAMDRLQRMTGATTDDRVIEHGSDFGKFLALG